MLSGGNPPDSWDDLLTQAEKESRRLKSKPHNSWEKQTMEAAITTAIFSSFLYDMLKHSVSITGGSIKNKLQGWLVSDDLSEKIAAEINQLGLHDEMSETAINNRLTGSSELLTLLNEIKPSNTIITQVHSGTGDNIAGNKIINS